MKNGKLFLTAILSTVILFTACKKDDPAPENTTLLKLQAKWNAEKMITHDFESGVNTRDTLPAIPGDYADFRTDNKVYLNLDGYMDTLPYSLSGTNKVIIGEALDQETYTISVLNDHQLHLYTKETFGADYYETTLTFIK